MFLLSINRYSYDPFLDFLKGICIIFVILDHCISPELANITLFCLWGDMAVPLFLLIQVFHAYKKELFHVNIIPKKLLFRIVLPFLLTQIVGALLLFLLTRGDFSVMTSFGNYGPGAYYPYIYLQFVLILWLLTPIFRYVRNSYVLCLIFILLSQVLEYVSIYNQIDCDIYRILFFRYTFLVFLGYLLATDKLVLNRYTFFIGVLSLLFILSANGRIGGGNILHGMFYMDAWQTYHWVSYFFVVYILLYVIHWLYNWLGEHNMLRHYLLLCGKYSYEIFLVQMIFYLFSPVNVIFTKVGFTSIYIEPFILLLNVLCCTITVLGYKKRNEIIDRIHNVNIFKYN